MSKGKTTKSLKGVNYGSMKMEKTSIDFLHNEFPIIKIPYDDIATTHCMNKSELLFELKNDSPDTYFFLKKAKSKLFESFKESKHCVNSGFLFQIMRLKQPMIKFLKLWV